MHPCVVGARLPILCGDPSVALGVFHAHGSLLGVWNVDHNPVERVTTKGELPPCLEALR